MRFPRFRSPRRRQPNPEAGNMRQRDILGRLVRGTEAPTDSLPVIVNPESTQLSEYYDARLGEVLELAVSIGSVLMASGMSASDTVIQVKAIAAAYGIENCDVDVTNTVIFIAVYRGPTLPPASTLHTVRSRSIDFSRLAAVDRLIRRIRTEPLPPRDGTRRTRQNRHRPAPVQALGRHPGLGRVGVLVGRHPGRRPRRLSRQRAEHDVDRPGEPTTQSARATVLLPARGRWGTSQPHRRWRCTSWARNSGCSSIPRSPSLLAWWCCWRAYRWWGRFRT